jgi:hypothetical protein
MYPLIESHLGNAGSWLMALLSSDYAVSWWFESAELVSLPRVSISPLVTGLLIGLRR